MCIVILLLWKQNFTEIAGFQVTVAKYDSMK